MPMKGSKCGVSSGARRLGDGDIGTSSGTSGQGSAAEPWTKPSPHQHTRDTGSRFLGVQCGGSSRVPFHGTSTCFARTNYATGGRLPCEQPAARYPAFRERHFAGHPRHPRRGLRHLPLCLTWLSGLSRELHGQPLRCLPRNRSRGAGMPGTLEPLDEHSCCARWICVVRGSSKQARRPRGSQGTDGLRRGHVGLSSGHGACERQGLRPEGGSFPASVECDLLSAGPRGFLLRRMQNAHNVYYGKNGSAGSRAVAADSWLQAFCSARFFWTCFNHCRTRRRFTPRSHQPLRDRLKM